MREATYIVPRRAVLIQIKTTTASIRIVVEIIVYGANPADRVRRRCPLWQIRGGESRNREDRLRGGRSRDL